MPSPLDFATPSPIGWFNARAISSAAGSALRAKADYDGYDCVIDTLAEADPSLKNGYYNHAPMVIEALFALGQGRSAQFWLDHARHTFVQRKPGLEPIDRHDWKRAMGDRARYSDWLDFFETEFSQAPWTDVLNIWVRRLAPGLSASAYHGALQTAHAARVVATSPTPARIRALANGLAAWASRYRELPLALTDTNGVLNFSATLGRITPLRAMHAAGEGAITTGFQQLVHAQHLSEEIGLADLDGDLNQRFDDLLTTFCLMFNDLVRTPYTAIVFAHAITGTEAARTLAQFAPYPIGRTLLFHAFAAGAGLKAAFSPLALQAPELIRALLPADPVQRAIAHGDDHVIKLTHVAISAYQRTRDCIFLDTIGQLHAAIPAQ